MNYKTKSGIDVVNKILSVILVAAIVFLIVAIALNLGDNKPADAVSEDTVVVAAIDELKPGTYGGIEFNSVEDVAEYYASCYNYTKTLTAPYINDQGEQVTFYKLLADEALSVNNILVEGKSNSMIDGLVPGIVEGIFSGGLNGMPPSKNRDPNLDFVEDVNIDLKTCHLTADDIQVCNVVDNGDGTIDISIQPKKVILSMPGQDAQGHYFNTLGDISSVVESISVLSFSSGTINDNFVVAYEGGSGTATIDTKTGEIIKGTYTMKVHVDVKHANVAVLKDKNASLDITYVQNLPASDEYMMKTKGVKRA